MTCVPGDRWQRSGTISIPAGPEPPEKDPEGPVPDPEPRMLLPLADRERLAQGRVPHGQSGPGQKRRPKDGDESRYQCFHEVSESALRTPS